MTNQIKTTTKQTEVGVIPEDWEVKLLGELAIIGSGGTPSRKNPTYWNGTIPWITTSQIDFDTITDAEQFITDEGLNNSAAKLLPANTLLLALYGQGKTRGKVARLGIDAATNQACASISITSNLLSDYLLCFLTSKYDEIRNFSNGGSQDNLNSQIVKQIPVIIPPLPEQTAIATALSDTDALIESLEKPIAKKRLIKQGAMQALLTGKKRLDGFSGEWEVKRLGEVGFTYGGITGKTKNDFYCGSSQYIPFLNIIGNVIIDVENLEQVNISESECQNQVKKGDLFFNGSSETPEEVGMCAVLLDDLKNVYLNSFCFGFRFFESVKMDELFLAYFFRSGVGRSLLYFLAQGATRYNLSKTNFLKLKISIPSIQEQTAIAQILSDMDSEIAALETKLDKTRQLKQGMMQELLTGRIRLINTIEPLE